LPEDGQGCLVLVVGPSGAGKDSLNEHARHALAAEGVTVARRIVTRPSTPDEPHDTLDPSGFAEAAKRGAFALQWQAHGLAYALPASIDRQLARGETVLCNVSRAVVADLRARYPRTFVIYVDAPLAIRQARIAGRRRRGEEPERAGRNQAFLPSDADRIVRNDADLHDACRAFEDAVREGMRIVS
jgi:ribose 1,5-bisphosphokinase